VKAGRHAVKGLRDELYISSQQLSRHAQHEDGGCSTHPSSRSAAKKSHGIGSGLSLAIISDVMSSPGINRHFVICIYTNKGHVTLAVNSPAWLQPTTESIILQLFDKCSIAIEFNVVQNQRKHIVILNQIIFIINIDTVNYIISAKCLQCLWTLLRS